MRSNAYARMVEKYIHRETRLDGDDLLRHKTLIRPVTRKKISNLFQEKLFPFTEFSNDGYLVNSIYLKFKELCKWSRNWLGYLFKSGTNRKSGTTLDSLRTSKPSQNALTRHFFQIQR
ncbi:hypothetical protein CEXT_488421 [Caerostris extrusa]|uniref:Uncharacterized protein n=1 Tax=Caerostris extrusa TaxID=172846 RepID=A0AAV4M8Z7_CAEEX|nr:hypothetical protein CEXT_488421 [Caerostris extrusa]